MVVSALHKHTFCGYPGMARILLVDDDKDLISILKTFLMRKGFDVCAIDNWELAAQNIRDFKPQLIILDVFLSGVDGLDLCRKLKSSAYTRHIPVLIVSGYPKVAETAIYEFGADDFITKPFEISDLIKKIHKIFSRKQLSQ